MSGSSPALYNCIDADVEWRSMQWIEEELKKVGLWDVYVSDVLDLQPILDHMHDKGMPVDAEIRLDRAIKLSDKQSDVLADLESRMPIEARKIEHVFVNPPDNREGLLERPSSRTVPTCDRCGLERPTKSHFRHLVKKSNPCDGAGIRNIDKPVTEFYRLAPFKPSRNQIIAYNNHFNRFTPLKKDKKTGEKKPSTDEKSLKDLIRKYPLDLFYLTVLESRELQKLQGTYIGYPDYGTNKGI